MQEEKVTNQKANVMTKNIVDRILKFRVWYTFNTLKQDMQGSKNE